LALRSACATGVVFAAALLIGACTSVEDERARPGADAGDASAAAVARTTIELALDGQRTRADVYRPARVADAAVVLAHGFTRSRSTLAGHAAALAHEGFLAVAPDLPYLVDASGNARALAELVARLRRGDFAPPVRRVVLVGFSAGGLAALLASGTDAVAGYLGLDPYDRSDHIGREFARTLRIPAALLRAPPSACNASSAAASWAQALPRIELDRLFEGATHCDFEAPTDWICRLACGAPDTARQQAIHEELLRTVRRWLAPAPAD
jgi:dienelactone hydrolase